MLVLISQMHQVTFVVLSCSCGCVWMEHVLSHWRRPELCRKWKLFYETWNEKGNFYCESVFVFFCLELAQLFRVAGRSGMTFAAWIVAVCFCETWNGCSREDWDRSREGILNPETGRYSEVVVILTELCVKITWMQVFPFWLRAIIPYCISRWMAEYGDICKPILAVKWALWSL